MASSTRFSAASGPESSRSPLTSPLEKPSRRRPQDQRRSAATSPSYQDDDAVEFVDEDDYDLRRSSSSSSSTRGRRMSNSIPISPPSVGSDDDYYQDGPAREVRAENVLGNWHFAPLLIAIVPPLGALLGGGADAWSDAILLVIASFYLYQLLKIPHDIYHTARTRRILNSDAEGQASDAGEDPHLRRERLAAAAELRRAEVISLFALVASPVAGAWLLSWLMETFTDGNRYLNKFNIRLFMLASGIKPWSHAISLFKKRLLHLQEVVHYPSSRVEFLNRRIGKLESDITGLRKLVAMKSDVSLLRDGIDAPLTQLSRTMRRYEKKEEHLRLSAEDKFSLMESRMEDLLREVAINAELIEEERRQRQRTLSLPLSIFQALKFALGQRSQEPSHRELLYDAPRGLPSSATSLKLSNGEEKTNSITEEGNGVGANVSSSVSTANMQQSLSSDSLPGYSSPPRYPVSPSKRSPTYPSSTYSISGSPSSPGWTEEGLAYWMFLPINIPKSVLRSAYSLARDRVTDVKETGYAQGYASVAGNMAADRQQPPPPTRLTSSKSTPHSLATGKPRFNGLSRSDSMKAPSHKTPVVAGSYPRRA